MGNWHLVKAIYWSPTYQPHNILSKGLQAEMPGDSPVNFDIPASFLTTNIKNLRIQHIMRLCGWESLDMVFRYTRSISTGYLCNTLLKPGQQQILLNNLYHY
jgi:hypothetical protein